MSNTTNTWLDGIVGTVVRSNGVEAPKEGAINFTGSVDVTDDPVNGQTTVNVRAGAATSLVAASTFSTGQAFRTGTSGHAELATANLRTVPFEGIALADILTSATGAFLLAGPVPFATHNLGAGVACAVGLNSSGVPVRATDPTCVSAPNWLGRCNTDGSYTIEPVNRGYVTPQDYGAKGDGVTDDANAFDAMLTGIGSVPAPGQSAPWNAHTEIVIPPGAYRFSRPWHIWRACNIRGQLQQGGFRSAGYELLGAPSTVLAFDKGVRGVVVDGWSGEFNAYANGNNVHVSDLCLFGGYVATAGEAGGVPFWGPAATIAAGDIRIPTYGCRFGYAYKARNSGTTGSIEPVWSTGDWPVPPPTYSATDNGITWDLIQSDGLTVNGLCTGERLEIVGFAGNGLMMAAGLGGYYASNGSRFRDLTIWYNGGHGRTSWGGDTNCNLFEAFTYQDNGGLAVNDQSLIGNTEIGPQTAQGGGNYWFRKGQLMHPYSEGGDGPACIEGGTLFGTLATDLISGDYYPDWQPGYTYNHSDVILESTSGQYWLANDPAWAGGGSGVSGGTRPNFVTQNGAPFARPRGNVAHTRDTVHDGTVTWNPYSYPGRSAAPTWRAGHSYTQNSRVKSTTTGDTFVNNGTTFTSGGVEPTWNTIVTGTTADNGGTWTCIGKGLPPSDGSTVSAVLGTRNLVVTNNTASPKVTMMLGMFPQQAFRLTTADDTGYFTDLKYDGTAHRWGLLNGYGYRYAWQVTTSGAPEGASRFLLPGGCFLGYISDGAAHPVQLHAGVSPPVGHSYADPTVWDQGSHIFNTDTIPGGPSAWVNLTQGAPAIAWQPSTTYLANTVIRPTIPNGHVYKNATGGTFTSGLTEPSWNTGGGSTTNDNGHNWTENGAGANFEPVGIIEPPDLLLKAVTGGTVTLTAWEAAHPRIKLTGTLVSDLIVIVQTPAVEYPYQGQALGLPGQGLGCAPNSWSKTFVNATSGAHSATVKAVSGDTGIVLPQGGSMLLLSDGANVRRSDDSPPRSQYLTTTGNTPTTLDTLPALVNGQGAEYIARVIAVSATDMAVFLLRGSCLASGGALTSCEAPAVLYGEPTDATHCTAGATTWRAALSFATGLTPIIAVTGQAATNIRWSYSVSYEIGGAP